MGSGKMVKFLLPRCFPFFCWFGTKSLINGEMIRQKTPTPFCCHKTSPATAQWLNANVNYVD